ncbi:Leucine-rich repeat 2 [Arabidopsis suecica]|uniref:Leucine-rich repeat 2 n=1 Tax=Arabidopsis suecica TaxID=45249 RepID=A0A8T2B0P2_ARASU|nr:Leucine-rich repeat 2 [Arabidopsis suecica]
MCSMLVKLNVEKVVFVDVTSPISFPSLKKLSLKYVIYPGNEFVQRLLSDCPVLESLVVKPIQGDNVTSFTIKVPSLKSLVLRKYEASDIAAGFVIDAPSLESFEIYDINEGSFCVIDESQMPNVVEANIEVMAYDPANILSAITSVKRLTIRGITASIPVGTVFSSLVYLEILTYNEAEWLTLLMRVLKDSPNLRALKLVQLHYEDDDEDDDRPCWSEPSSVPECVKWSLNS